MKSLQWKPLTVGLLFVGLVIGVSVGVPLPDHFRWPAVLGFLGTGLVTGYLVGRTTIGNWEARRRNALTVGIVGGFLLSASYWLWFHHSLLWLGTNTVFWEFGYTAVEVAVAVFGRPYSEGAIQSVWEPMVLWGLFVFENLVAAVVAANRSSVSPP